MCDPLAWHPLLLALVASLVFSRGLVGSGHAVASGHALTSGHRVTPDHAVTPPRDAGPASASGSDEDRLARKRRLARARQRRCRARRASQKPVGQRRDTSVTTTPIKKPPLSLVPSIVVSTGKEVEVESARASPQKQSLMLPLAGGITQAKRPKGKDNEGQRGSWLPADWHPDTEQLAFAEDCGLDAAETAERFRDYWIAAAGPNGRKRDWGATWRNWCRREAKSDTRLGTRSQRDHRRPGSVVAAAHRVLAAGPLRGSGRP